MNRNECIELLCLYAQLDKTFVKKVRRTYDVKKAANPRMVDFQTWLHDVWATQNVKEAEACAGKVDYDLTWRIARIEYDGTPTIKRILHSRGLKYWMAYVEEGTLNARVDARDKACAKSVKEIFEADGYEAEIVEDYDDKWIPVMATKKFAA